MTDVFASSLGERLGEGERATEPALPNFSLSPPPRVPFPKKPRKTGKKREKPKFPAGTAASHFGFFSHYILEVLLLSTLPPPQKAEQSRAKASKGGRTALRFGIPQSALHADTPLPFQVRPGVSPGRPPVWTAAARRRFRRADKSARSKASDPTRSTLRAMSKNAKSGQGPPCPGRRQLFLTINTQPSTPNHSLSRNNYTTILHPSSSVWGAYAPRVWGSAPSLNPPAGPTARNMIT
jgi:hypothetical protein